TLEAGGIEPDQLGDGVAEQHRLRADRAQRLIERLQQVTAGRWRFRHGTPHTISILYVKILAARGVCGVRPVLRFQSTTIASAPRRAGSPMTSTRVTFLPLKVNVSTRDSLPRGAKINPTEPLITAGCTDDIPRESATNRLTHVEAPLTSRATGAASGAPPAMPH